MRVSTFESDRWKMFLQSNGYSESASVLFSENRTVEISYSKLLF